MCKIPYIFDFTFNKYGLLGMPLKIIKPLSNTISKAIKIKVRKLGFLPNFSPKHDRFITQSSIIK